MQMLALKYKREIEQNIEYRDVKFIGMIDEWEIYECSYYGERCLGAIKGGCPYLIWGLYQLRYLHKQGHFGILRVVCKAYLKYYINKNQCPCKC